MNGRLLGLVSPLLTVITAFARNNDERSSSDQTIGKSIRF